MYLLAYLPNWLTDLLTYLLTYLLMYLFTYRRSQGDPKKAPDEGPRNHSKQMFWCIIFNMIFCPFKIFVLFILGSQAAQDDPQTAPRWSQEGPQGGPKRLLKTYLGTFFLRYIFCSLRSPRFRTAYQNLKEAQRGQRPAETNVSFDHDTGSMWSSLRRSWVLLGAFLGPSGGLLEQVTLQFTYALTYLFT